MDITDTIAFLVIICEYVMSFAIVFGACIPYRRIIRLKPKKYLLFSTLTALIIPLWFLVSIYFKDLGIREISSELVILLYTLLFWLFITDRKPRQLVVSFAAMIFSGYIALGTSVRFINLGEIIFDSSVAIYPLICRFFGNTLSLMFIILVSELGNKKIDEPLSLSNICVLALITFISSVNMYIQIPVLMGMDAFDESLIGFLTILIAVILSVRDSESKYYSRLNKMNENYLAAQENYYKSRQSAEIEIRRIKHDMNNHMICINELCRKGRYKELSDYIGSMTEKFAENDSLIFNTGDNIANAIISDKMLKSRENKIRFSVHGSLENSGIAPIDMCAILANLLDNAICAASRMPDGQRTIELEFRQNVYFLMITVVNDTDRPVSIENTTKTDKINHGFGIYNVRNAAKKYDGEVSFSCNKKGENTYCFKAEIMFPKIA